MASLTWRALSKSIGVSLPLVASGNGRHECGGLCLRSSFVCQSELGASLRLSSAVSSTGAVKKTFKVRASGKIFHMIVLIERTGFYIGFQSLKAR